MIFPEIKKNFGFGCMRLPLLDGNDQTSFDYEQICKMVDSYLEQGFIYFAVRGWVPREGA